MSSLPPSPRRARDDVLLPDARRRAPAVQDEAAETQRRARRRRGRVRRRARRAWRALYPPERRVAARSATSQRELSRLFLRRDVSDVARVAAAARPAVRRRRAVPGHALAEHDRGGGARDDAIRPRRARRRRGSGGDDAHDSSHVRKSSQRDARANKPLERRRRARVPRVGRRRIHERLRRPVLARAQRRARGGVVRNRPRMAGVAMHATVAAVASAVPRAADEGSRRSPYDRSTH